jgi:hypothetical protein
VLANEPVTMYGISQASRILVNRRMNAAALIPLPPEFERRSCWHYWCGGPSVDEQFMPKKQTQSGEAYFLLAIIRVASSYSSYRKQPRFIAQVSADATPTSGTHPSVCVGLDQRAFM